MRKGILIKEGDAYWIEDIMSKEAYQLKDEEQRMFIEKSGYNDYFYFFTLNEEVEKTTRAVVLTKEAEFLNMIHAIAPLGNAYGKYVAQQKASGEGAKEFTNWYFDVSI